MSVLSQARNTLNTIGKRFGDRTAVAANTANDSAAAVSAVNMAETKTKAIGGVFSKMAQDSQNDVASIQAVVAQTQTADRSNAVSAATNAANKAKVAAEANARLEEKYKELRAAMESAKTAGNDAKAAHANAKVAIQKMASSL